MCVCIKEMWIGQAELFPGLPFEAIARNHCDWASRSQADAEILPLLLAFFEASRLDEARILNSMKQTRYKQKTSRFHRQMLGFCPMNWQDFNHNLNPFLVLPGSLQPEGARTGGPEVSSGHRPRLEICVPGLDDIQMTCGQRKWWFLQDVDDIWMIFGSREWWSLDDD